MLQNCKLEEKQLIATPISNFPNRKFEIIKIIGKGGEGTVCLAKSINWGFNDQKQFALKFQIFLKPEEIQFIDHIIAYQNQNENQFKKGQENYQPSKLIRIYERFQLKDQNIIIMEVGEIDLYEYIKQQKTLEFEQKIDIMIQISQSIQFLHKLQLIHRDIKPENFIKVGDQFKLIDFGLTKQNSILLKTAKIGTPLFQAPELIEGQTNYNFSVDIWSLGCVFYEILSGEPLFNGVTLNQVHQMILSVKQNSTFLNQRLSELKIDQNLADLIKQMLKYNSLERIKIENVLSTLNLFNINKTTNQFQLFYNNQNQTQIQETKTFIPQKSQIFANSNEQPNYIQTQISQLVGQFQDFDNKQTERNNKIESLFNQLLINNTQLQEKIQQLEIKIDNTLQQKKEINGDQNQYNVKKFEDKLKESEEKLQDKEKQYEKLIQQYQKKIIELEIKLDEENYKNNKIEKELQQHNLVGENLKQVEQDQNIKDDFKFQVSQKQQEIIESQQNLKNNNNVKIQQFDNPLAKFIEDMKAILDQIETYSNIKSNQSQQSQKNKDEQKKQIDILMSIMKKIVDLTNKGDLELKEVKQFFYDQKKINFGKLKQIIDKFYTVIQTQSNRKLEQKPNQKDEIQQNLSKQGQLKHNTTISQKK